VPTKRSRVHFPVDPETLKLLEEWADSETRSIPNLCETEMKKAVNRWKLSRDSPRAAGAIKVLKDHSGNSEPVLAAIAVLEELLS